jgi:hypothetical protein
MEVSACLLSCLHAPNPSRRVNTFTLLVIDSHTVTSAYDIEMVILRTSLFHPWEEKGAEHTRGCRYIRQASEFDPNLTANLIFVSPEKKFSSRITRGFRLYVPRKASLPPRVCMLWVGRGRKKVKSEGESSRVARS